MDVQIRAIDGPAFPPAMGKGEFQAAYGWFGEEQEPVFTLWLGTNWQRYQNEQALGLLRQALTTPGRARRIELVRAFQAQAAEDVPTLPLAPRVLLNAARTRLRGYAPSVGGEPVERRRLVEGVASCSRVAAGRGAPLRAAARDWRCDEPRETRLRRSAIS